MPTIRYNISNVLCTIAKSIHRLIIMREPHKENFPKKVMFIRIFHYNPVGQDSSVGIATRYGLDGPEIESHWE
jgi:hypothetical protein